MTPEEVFRAMRPENGWETAEVRAEYREAVLKHALEIIEGNMSRLVSVLELVPARGPVCMVREVRGVVIAALKAVQEAR